MYKNERPVPLSSLASDIPPALEPAVSLEPRPKDFYQSLEDFVVEI